MRLDITIKKAILSLSLTTKTSQQKLMALVPNGHFVLMALGSKPLETEIKIINGTM